MRVIAGKYRARILREFDITSTRPTLDRVKEALFSSIQFNILNSSVLDLFAGTGALGIEALSRGARNVTFVDKDERAIKLIKENTKGMTESFEIYKAEYDDFLTKTKKKFDIVLLDPPYASDYGEKAIKIILEKNLLNNGGILVYEKSADSVFNFSDEGFSLKVKRYGAVEVVFLRKEK